MSGMDSEQRVTLTYTGDVGVTIGGHAADPDPATVEPGGTVTVNADVVETLLAGGLFTVDGAAPEGLAGAALDDALRDAGLPLTGTADEKRQRLAEHHTDPDSEQE